MAENGIENLVNFKDESEWVEFKINHSEPQKIGEYLSALSNSACLWNQSYGYIVWGIDHTKQQVVGTTFKPRESKKGNEDLEPWLARGLEPRVDFEIQEFKKFDKDIVVFKIEAAKDKPVKFYGTSYIRVGSNKHPLSAFPEKERKIWKMPLDLAFETQITLKCQTADDVLKKINYPSFFKLLGLPLPENKQSILEKLELEGIVHGRNELYDITNMGAILFASDLKEFPKLTRKAVRIITYLGNDKLHTTKDFIIYDGYAILFESTIDFIMNLLPSNEIIKDAIRVESKLYPKLAIREFVANALIHQNFLISGSGPTIEIFKNRMEIVNPGNPLIDPIRFIDHPPMSRNEKLASLMRRMNVCEERGSGVDRAIDAIELFQLPAPDFKAEEDFMCVTLFSHRELNTMNKIDKIRACYQHCVLRYICKEPMTNTSLRERFGIKENNYPIASGIIKDTIGAKLIVLANPENKSPRMRKYVPFWA